MGEVHAARRGRAGGMAMAKVKLLVVVGLKQKLVTFIKLTFSHIC